MEDKKVDDDIDSVELHAKSSVKAYVITKILTIILAIIVIIYSIYYAIIALNDQNSKNKVLMLICTIIHVPFLLFVSLMLYFDDNLNNMLVVFTVILSPTIELAFTITYAMIVNYQDNIFGLVLNLTFAELTVNLCLMAIIKMLSSREREQHRLEQEERANKEKTSEQTSEQTKTMADLKEKKKKRERERLTLHKIVKHNFIEISSVVSIALAIVIGSHIKTNLWLSSQELKYIGFIGELFLRVVDCLVFPLILIGFVYSVASLSIRKTYKKAIRLLLYYLITTLLAVLLGITMVHFLMKPLTQTLIVKTNSRLVNNSTEKIDNSIVKTSDSTNETEHHFIHIVLDVIRNLFPENIIQSTFQTYRTSQTNSSGHLSFGTIGHYIYQPNVLGLISVAFVIGLTLSVTSKQSKNLILMIEIINDVIIKITKKVVKVLPIALIFLIIPQIIDSKDESTYFQRIALFTIIVLVGLSIVMFVVLPLIFILTTRKNPLKYMWNMFPAIKIATATSSPWAASPITIRCLDEHNFINEKVIQFCINSGLNMVGTALYESAAVIFIMITLGMDVTLSVLFLVTITSTLASIALAGTPQAGLITLVIVLNTLGIPKEEIGIVLIADWFLCRFATVVNIMCEAYGAGIIHHMVLVDE